MLYAGIVACPGGVASSYHRAPTAYDPGGFHDEKVSSTEQKGWHPARSGCSGYYRAVAASGRIVRIGCYREHNLCGWLDRRRNVPVLDRDRILLGRRRVGHGDYEPDAGHRRGLERRVRRV